MERRKTILICDDEPALRELIRASMDDGFEFAEASDGVSAMQLAQEVDPDVVILDLMPAQAASCAPSWSARPSQRALASADRSVTRA